MAVSEKQIIANRKNWAKRGELTTVGRRRLRLSALKNRPWERATGPKSTRGKMRSRQNSAKSGENSAFHLAVRAYLITIGRWQRMTWFLLDHLGGSGKPQQSTFARYRGRLADYMMICRRLKRLPPDTKDTTTCTEWLREHQRLARIPVVHGEIRLNVVLKPRRPSKATRDDSRDLATICGVLFGET